MNMDNYLINIDEDETLGMSAISLVEYPAIEVNFLKFDKQEPLKFQADEDKQMLFGPVIIADQPIYRRNGLYEYNVIFNKETIEKLAERYSKNNLWNSINLQHQDDTFVDSVVMVECFIKDSEKGISPKGFEQVSDGSLFARFHVQDSKLWSLLKSDEFNGFSIEVCADLVPTNGKFSETPNAP